MGKFGLHFGDSGGGVGVECRGCGSEEGLGRMLWVGGGYIVGKIA